MRFSISAKTILMIILISTLLSASAIGLSFYVLRTIIDDDYKDDAECLAATTAVSLNIDDVKALADQASAIYETAGDPITSENWGTPEFEEYVGKFSVIEQMDEFDRVHRALTLIQDQNSCDCIYITLPLPGNSGYMYLVDADKNDPCQPGTIDHYVTYEMSSEMNPNHDIPAYITNTDEYGWLVTAGKGIADDDGNIIAIVGCDYSMEEIRANERQHRIRMAIMLGIITFVACVIGIFIVRLIFVKPIKKLSAAAADYYTADKEPPYDTFEKIEIHTHDEVETLADSMKKMERDINDYLSELLITSDVLAATEDWAEELKAKVDDNPENS